MYPFVAIDRWAAFRLDWSELSELLLTGGGEVLTNDAEDILNR